MNSVRENIINAMLMNAYNIRKINDIFRDDEGVIAAAILSSNSGGEWTLSYASERLRNDSRLLQLVSIAKNFEELKKNVLSSAISETEKNRYLQQIEDKKRAIIEKNFSVGKRSEGVRVNATATDYYLDGSVISDDLKSLIDRVVVGTNLNHSSNDMIFNLGCGIHSFFKDFVKNPRLGYAADRYTDLTKYISGYSIIFGIPLRMSINNYYTEHNKYPILCYYGKSRNITDVESFPSMLFSIDLLKLALKNSTLEARKKNKILNFLKNVDLYLAAEKFASDNAEDMTLAMQVRLKIQNLFNDISRDDISELLHSYFDSLDPKEVFRVKSIVIEEVTDTAKEVLTNASEFSLRDSFHAILLDGKIDIASDKGYRHGEKDQEDAVGSAVRDETHFINIVADGVGSDINADMGSKILVEELTSWYNSLPRTVLDDLNALVYGLKSKIIEVNRRLYEQYNEKAATTLVLALTAGDKTLIANIGDSTAYGYNEEKDELELLSVIDSPSAKTDSPTKKLSYEDIRHSSDNLSVSAVVGSRYNYDLHTRIIPNNGQRIILSSDGVTDLISEENYKRVFRNRVDAQSIVDKAKFWPDVYSGMKNIDNISAIVIDLPENAYVIGKGR